MKKDIQINVKFRDSNPEHKAAASLIRKRSRDLGYSYATYITMAVLAYEQMDMASVTIERMQNILNEFDIKKREKIIPKM